MTTVSCAREKYSLPGTAPKPAERTKRQVPRVPTGENFAAGNSGTRLLCGVDLRDHDRACADIQSLIDPDIAAARYADDRANAGDVCCTDQIGEFLEGGGAVLHIEQHEIISGMTCGFHHRRVRADREQAKRARSESIAALKRSTLSIVGITDFLFI